MAPISAAQESRTREATAPAATVATSDTADAGGGGTIAMKGVKMTQAELATEPKESWETAFVFAFVHRFTSITVDLETCFLLQTAMDLEAALSLKPPAHSPALEAILKVFYRNLKQTSSNATWQRWLLGYVDTTIQQEKDAAGGNAKILKWDSNRLRRMGKVKLKAKATEAQKATEAVDDDGLVEQEETKELGFWGLDWREKIHLLRILVDHQLTFSNPIRDLIENSYGLKDPALKTAKRKNEDGNPLVIESLGLDREVKTWWQVDDSPRLYCSGNPYKPTCSWTPLSSSQEELAAAKSTLAKAADASSEEKVAPVFQRMKKGGEKESNKRLKFEWALRKHIETKVELRVQAGKERIVALYAAKEKADTAAARKAARAAQQAAAAAAAVAADPAIRSSRLRTQVKRPDYLVDSISDRQFERQLEKFNRGEEVDLSSVAGSSLASGSVSGSGGGKPARDKAGKKRRRFGVEDEGDEEWDDFGVDDDDARSRSGKGGRRAVKAVKKREWRGERRSSRIQQIAEEEEAEETLSSEEEVIRPSASTWSRSRAYEALEPKPPENELGGNVSIWSKGKLVYVNGDNRYASKPIAAPAKRPIAKAGGVLVIKCPDAPSSSNSVNGNDAGVNNGGPRNGYTTSEGTAPGVSPTSAKSSGGLMNPQSRLAAMDGEDSSSDEGSVRAGATRPKATTNGNAVNGGRSRKMEVPASSITSLPNQYLNGGVDMDIDGNH